ncbi:MAG: hypothetical protein NWE83_02985 [Candidatus Bathyarchaeota archaeon]|jgi:allantoin racemase|nr:hypothetical protein [Candidatus Bathyarchaeota archaeon]
MSYDKIFHWTKIPPVEVKPGFFRRTLISARVPVSAVNQDKTRAEQALLQEYIYARDNDGAEAVIPGNMSLAFLQHHREHSMKVGIPVLDPVSLSVKMAELLVALELTQSKRAYPSPRHEY